ncbi:MAG: hypothetical protein SH856_04025 [Flavobacteriales bacterium]|nr:hypothetical protein [Flavobacteriales bacterium]
MTEKQRKIEQLQRDLFSSDNAVVISALRKCLDSGDTSMVIPLIHLYATTKIALVKTEAAEMLGSLKVSGAENAFMTALNDGSLKRHRKDILAFMWNSNMQPTDHLSVIIGIAVDGNLEEAIECLTLVESMSGPFSSDQLKDSIAAVHEFLVEEEASEKLSLMRELLAVLETAPEA